MPKIRRIDLEEKDIKALVIAIKKIVGQLNSVSNIIENNKVSDQTFTQLLAIKGGASHVCKEIISRGVLSNIKNYNMNELNHALEIIFKLDK